MTRKKLLTGVLAGLLAAAALPYTGADLSHAQGATLEGRFSIAYDGYNEVPLLVGMVDASPYFGPSPVLLPPPDKQVMGTVRGNASNGRYSITIPDQPMGTPFDVTGGGGTSNGLQIFDVRIYSDVGRRGYLAQNEDNIASSIRINIDYSIGGGTLIVWAANDQQQFPTDVGPDGKLFTSDDPRTALPAGWSMVDISTAPYTAKPAGGTIDLITTGIGDSVDYSDLACKDLIPAFLDRLEKTYPFTDLYGTDDPPNCQCHT
jgi:hypothetical protein